MVNIHVVQICGLILWAVFYGSYLAKILLERKKGISVSRMCIGKQAAEEKYMERKHGEAYKAYRAKVRRYL